MENVLIDINYNLKILILNEIMTFMMKNISIFICYILSSNIFYYLQCFVSAYI